MQTMVGGIPVVEKILVWEDRLASKMICDKIQLFPQNLNHINCLTMSSARERAEWEFADTAYLVLCEDA